MRNFTTLTALIFGLVCILYLGSVPVVFSQAIDVDRPNNEQTAQMEIFLPLVSGPTRKLSPQEQADLHDHATHDHSGDDYALAKAARLRNEPPFEIDEAQAAATGPLNEVGQWGSVFTWPFVFQGAANLPDGRILAWGANGTRSFSGGNSAYSSVWDPATGQLLSRNHNDHPLFCSIPTMMEDGRVFTNGGDANTNKVSTFDYRTNQWARTNNMSTGRWYPGSVALPSGQVFTMMGRPGGPYPEVWTEGQGWTLRTGANLNNGILNYSGYQSTWLPYVHLMPNGNVFHSGPTTQMNVINPNGNGSIASAGLTNSWYPKYSTSIKYDEGKILVAGGAANSTSTSPGTDQAMIIDVNGSTPTKTAIDPMGFARKFSNGTILPNGEVLIIGGNSSGKEFSDQGSVLAAEIWNPSTQTWREVANMSVPRNYHSVALLMTDGRVWSGGGGLCNCSADHPDHQVYSPPYLFNADGSLATRPTIDIAPTVAINGQSISVQASSGIQKFSLIKMSGTSHNLNSDLHYVNVPFTGATGQYELTLHNNSNVLTPGYWMLFAINNQGVPSISKVIQISSTPPPPQGNGSGQILREWWTGINGVAINDLTSNANYPDNPTGSEMLTSFETPTNQFDNFGSRVRGYLHAPITGQYRFWIASDDNGQLLLSTDDSPANAVQIANVPGWASSRQWDKYSQQQSALITLQAGQRYYIEALYKEGGGGDNLAVAWQIPGFSRTVIAGEYLSPYGISNQYRYVRLVADSEVNGNPWTSAAEFNVLNSSGNALNRSGWSITADSEETAGENGRATNAIDGDTATIWHTQWQAANPAHPHQIVVDMGTTHAIGGFRYLPRQAGAINGTIAAYRFYVSVDGVNWGAPVAQGTFANDQSEKTVTFTLSGNNQPPVLTNPGDQSNIVGATANLAISATDPDGDTLNYSATGLPANLSINSNTGAIAGTATGAGTYNATVTVNDGNGNSDSVNFTWTIYDALTLSSIMSSPQPIGTAINYTASANGGANPRFKWLFGDNTPETSYSSTPSIAHTFTQPGQYIVTLTATDDSGAEVTEQFTQLIHRPLTAQLPAVSMSIIYEARGGTDRVWNVNPDNDTVTVSNAVTNQKIAEIGVGSGPRSLAIAPDGRIWVTNKHDASISIIDEGSLNVVQTITLPFASQPYGIAFAPSGSNAFVALEATGTLLKLNPSTGAQVDSTDVGPNPRHLSVLADSSRVYVSRFISPLTPGEETANPQLNSGGGEVVVVNSTNMNIVETIALQYGNRPDSEGNGRGIPNYLGPAVISPDGEAAWIPSKQDNIARGVQRDGQNLDHDHTVRSITSYIDLGNNQEQFVHRIDHDNGGIASSGQFEPLGAFLFVALEGSREVAVIDAYARGELFRIDVGRAPQGIVVSPDGLTLYVHNFMDRSVGVYDLSDLLNSGQTNANELATIDVVGSEQLSAQVLNGKQLFYDAKDPRLALDSYMSCAACHNDGGQDGRIWDMTGFGEGLRNTIDLNGRAGTDQGPLHWSANFDEVQDFENQIRNFAGGTGLMSNSDFNATQDPLGTSKAGRSADLDALAAYVSSLSTVENSPYRNSNGSLTATAETGRTIFESQSCASCHGGASFTDSAPNNLHNIGTIKPTSGERIGGPLTGIDSPTLRGLWSSAPYLHDGSAATLGDAVEAHNNVALDATELNQIVTYLNQIDDNEPAPSINNAPTANAGLDQTLTDGNNSGAESVTLDGTGSSDGDGTIASYVWSSDSGVSIPTGAISSANFPVGTHIVTLTVTDDDGATAVDTVTLTVNAAANNAPTADAGPDQTLTDSDDSGAESVTLDGRGSSDGDGTIASYEWSSDTGISISTGATPSANFPVGTHFVTLTVTDDDGATAVDTVTIIVNAAANNPPSVTSPGNQTTTVGDSVSLTIVASDADSGDTLTFAATNLPAGLSLNTATGAITGAPTTAGSATVTVSVNDGNGGSDSVSFTWTVEEAPTQTTVPVYDDVLRNGWRNWSWAASINLSSGAQVHTGATAIEASLNAYGALSLSKATPIDTSQYEGFGFWIHGGSGGQDLILDIRDSAGTRYGTDTSVDTTAGAWIYHEFAFATLGELTDVVRLTIKNGASNAAPTFYVDDVVLVADASAPPPPPPSATTTLYDDLLRNDWQDYSWADVDLAIGAPVQEGSKSIGINAERWKALYLFHAAPVDLSQYQSVGFWVHGGSAGNQRIALKAVDGIGNRTSYEIVTPTANAWTYHEVPFSSFGSPSDIKGLIWQNWSGSTIPEYFVDNIVFIESAGAAAASKRTVGRGHGEIEGAIWYDLNQDSKQTAGEIALPDMLVVLVDLGANGTLDASDPIIARQRTDEEGRYAFGELANGNYLVTVGTLDPRTVQLDSSQMRSASLVAGNQLAPQSMGIFSGDLDGDRIPDLAEGSGDQDEDGLPNYADTDSDGDGTPDALDEDSTDTEILFEGEVQNTTKTYLPLLMR